MFASLMFVFTVSSPTFAKVDAQNIANTSRDQSANNCLLPPYPEHGRYTFSNNPSARPGQKYSSVKLDISCDHGYKIENNIQSIFCFNGQWSASMPTCVSDMQGFCTLPTDDLRVEYRCVSAPGSLESSQECKSFVSSGTVVTPICRSPAYFSLKPLYKMHCRDGMWDYSPICQRACGVTTQHQQLEGTSINHLELPWHAVIYKRYSNWPRCGGSLITATKIISGASCFYDYNIINDVPRPVNDFVVAVNKIYHEYKDPRDKYSQFSDVVDIKVPSNYLGRTAFYENDIAIAIVEKPFFLHLSVQPVCLDFDNNLDRIQLSEENYGKKTPYFHNNILNYLGYLVMSVQVLTISKMTITGNYVSNEFSKLMTGSTYVWSSKFHDIFPTVHWQYDNHQLSKVLNVVDIPYMKNEDCDLPPGFRQYLTKDKFCSRYSNGTESTTTGTIVEITTTAPINVTGTWNYELIGGSGFAFLESSTQRYYLRGVVSYERSDLNNYIRHNTYTSIVKHEDFIKQHL